MDRKKILGTSLIMLMISISNLMGPKITLAESSVEVYLIDILGVSTWWSDRDSTEIAIAARALFEANGFNVEIVTDFDRLDYVVNNSPANVIVINTHGEVMPMSTSWSDWTEYFTKLGNNIRDHGWIFVSTIGYPFFYYDRGSGMHSIGSQGVNTFLSAIPELNVQCKVINAGEPAYASYITSDGEAAASYVGTSLPSRTITIRPHRWSVDPDYVFYLQIDDPWAEEGFKYGASAVSMGNGFFVLNGFGDGRLEPEVPYATNRTVGEAAAAFSAFIMGKPAVAASSIDINPDVLNSKSKGKWITAYIQLPEEYNPADIDATTILLNETIQPVLNPKYDFVTISSEYLVDHNEDGILERMVKFDRREVMALLSASEVIITITGEVNGIPFEGSDTIRVIN